MLAGATPPVKRNGVSGPASNLDNCSRVKASEMSKAESIGGVPIAALVMPGMACLASSRMGRHRLKRALRDGD
jgi:hypothetical protein